MVKWTFCLVSYAVWVLVSFSACCLAQDKWPSLKIMPAELMNVKGECIEVNNMPEALTSAANQKIKPESFP